MAMQNWSGTGWGKPGRATVWGGNANANKPKALVDALTSTDVGTPSRSPWMIQYSNQGSAGLQPQWVQRNGVGASNVQSGWSGGASSALANPAPAAVNVGNYQIYTPQDIREQQNMALAQGAQATDLDWLQKRATQPGMSQSAGTMSFAVPLAIQSRVGGAQNALSQQIDMNKANALYNTEQQMADRDAWFAAQRNYLQRANAQAQYNTARRNALFNALMGGMA